MRGKISKQYSKIIISFIHKKSLKAIYFYWPFLEREIFILINIALVIDPILNIKLVL